MTIERNGIRIVLRSMRSKGYNQKHILLVGYSSAAEGFIDRVNKNPEWGYTIRGIIDDTKERGSEYKGVKVIGCIEDLDYILEQNSLDEIAVTLSLSEYENSAISLLSVKIRRAHEVYPGLREHYPDDPVYGRSPGPAGDPYPPRSVE